MPIDRHTPKDEFDRNDDARVETGSETGAGIEKSGHRRDAGSDTGSDIKAADKKVTAKTAKPAAKTATGKKATGKKARPTGVTRRTAAATDIPGKTQAGDRSADNVVTDRVSVSGASGRKKAARKTAQNRAGRTARSKEAALKEMAQQHLVAKRTGEAAGDAAAKRSAEEAGRADKAALEAMLKTRRADKVGQAGQGVIWSLLALGLAACGGGTNTIRVAGGPVEEPGIRRPARGDESGIRRPAGRKPERPCRASQ